MPDLIYQDVESIMQAIVDHFATDPLAANDIIIDKSKVGYLSVKSGIEPPYVLIMDAGAERTTTFGNHEAFSDVLYIIRVIAIYTEDLGAFQVAKLIHGELFNALDGKRLPLEGFEKGLRLKAMQREPPHEESVESETVYLHTGRKWHGTTAQ